MPFIKITNIPNIKPVLRKVNITNAIKTRIRSDELNIPRNKPPKIFINDSKAWFIVYVSIFDKKVRGGIPPTHLHSPPTAALFH